MGVRTVVCLQNDLAHEWVNDPNLGSKIHHSACMKGTGLDDYLKYGTIVEQTHADNQHIVLFDGYEGIRVASGHRRHNESEYDRNVRLIKEAADNLGYRLVKKPEPKA